MQSWGVTRFGGAAVVCVCVAGGALYSEEVYALSLERASERINNCFSYGWWHIASRTFHGPPCHYATMNPTSFSRGILWTVPCEGLSVSGAEKR